jgi:hypothetical protein
VISQRDIAFLTCLGPLGRHNTDNIISIFSNLVKASKEGNIARQYQDLLVQRSLTLAKFAGKNIIDIAMRY